MEKIRTANEKYKVEIDEINGILGNLYKERIYGYNGNNCNQDGSLQENIIKLIGKLNQLINKIELGEDSTIDEINGMFKVDLYV